MFSGINAFSHEIKLPIRPINEISKIFDFILLDNPMMFYISSFNHLSDLNKQKCLIRPNYKYAHNFIRQSIYTITKYLQVFDAIKTGNDVDKEIFIHDFCLNNFVYDNTFNDYSYSILGPVFNKSGVCEGIAKFVKLSLDYLGVNNLVVHGKAKNPVYNDEMEMHAWNIVKIEGNMYHLDVTFDMSMKDKINRYDYFNLTDQDIKKEHIFNGNVPACITGGNDYFSVKSLIAYNPSELDTFIKNGLIQGKKNIIVKLKNVNDSETIVDKVIKLAQQQYGNIYKRNGVVEVKYNQSQLIFEIDFM
jgi:transglutaminase/protease-like cytokinesis protein 3